jgi:hypothetical protein
MLKFGARPMVACAVASVLVMQVGAVTFAPAGTVTAVRVWAYGTPPETSSRRDLFLEDPVFVRERLETVPDGALHVRLLDDTVLRLGSGTVLVLDEYVYAPDSGTLSLLANVAKGVCRFVISTVSIQRVVVSTPTAAVTTRGTEFSVWVADDGSTTVWVQDGAVEVAPRDGSPPAIVEEGDIVLVRVGGGGVVLDAPRPSSDPGLAPTPRVLMPRGKNK